MVLIVMSALLILALQSACLLPWFKKAKKATVTPPTQRIVLLPFNMTGTDTDKDVRWAALAAPIMMAKVSERARDIEITPLWETMPVALEAAGASRTFTKDSSASAASWLGAKWSAMGEFSPAKHGLLMIVDFIPAKSTDVAFRYQKSGGLA